MDSKPSVDSFLTAYPRVRLATAADNQGLLEFFRNSAMNADNISLRFDRSPDFFRYLNIHSQKSYVAIFQNEDGGTGGLASLCLRKNYLSGKPVEAAYLGDLRLSPNLSRSTRLQWRLFYADFLKNARRIPELNNCRYFYSVVLDENKAAMMALTRKNGPIVYRPLARYQTISLIARWPSFSPRKKKSRFTIRQAAESDRDRLREFLTEQHKRKIFGQYYNLDSESDELARRLNAWDKFSISSFWIAEDFDGKFRACVCPWMGASASRQLIIGKMPLYLRLIGRMLPLFGKRKLATESELKILYLTPLEFDAKLSVEEQGDILTDFLNVIYDSGVTKNFHLISFFDFLNHSLIGGVKDRGFLYQLTPATLYQVLHRDFESEEGLDEIKGDELPGLDIGTA